MIQEPLDERVLNSNYEIIKNIAFKISAEMNKDKMKLLDLEKGFRDRKNIMGVKRNRENALFNKAVELYCKTGYSKEFLYDLFKVFSKEDFNYYLGLFKQDYENALKLLEKGVEKKLIIDDFNISELIFYFAEESFKNKK
ncbi:hypothetical protein BX659_1763 [Orenia metallireducens]|uniref:Uncharacterized protein n=1 Tax=Orenia metallireducens TaxID=1413210 RepID=A0A285IKM4_9FIRM|nr:hypothetical protein [Orenia metallireducens]PRX16172.1 hypothetical protein BX659_1763 [Orenia metallireducens]SNY48297.1 hypothetical protein SAMN06265827_1753 [Orenia metallireducens]